jgi:hypothetical protein
VSGGPPPKDSRIETPCSLVSVPGTIQSCEANTRQSRPICTLKKFCSSVALRIRQQRRAVPRPLTVARPATRSAPLLACHRLPPHAHLEPPLPLPLRCRSCCLIRDMSTWHSARKSRAHADCSDASSSPAQPVADSTHQPARWGHGCVHYDSEILPWSEQANLPRFRNRSSERAQLRCVSRHCPELHGLPNCSGGRISCSAFFQSHLGTIHGPTRTNIWHP